MPSHQSFGTIDGNSLSIRNLYARVSEHLAHWMAQIITPLKRKNRGILRFFNDDRTSRSSFIAHCIVSSVANGVDSHLVEVDGVPYAPHTFLLESSRIESLTDKSRCSHCGYDS